MALKGIAFDAGKRRVGEYKIGPAASAGLFYRLGSTNQFLQLASHGDVSQVLEWDVTATGVEDVDLLKGIEIRETQVNKEARTLELAVGDLIRTNQLASGSDYGPIDGTLVTGQALTFQHDGKARKIGTGEVAMARIAGVNNANTFDTDGLIWLEIVRLA